MPEDDRLRHDRSTAECPVCGGIAQKKRSGEQYLCHRCARHLDAEEVEGDV